MSPPDSTPLLRGIRVLALVIVGEEDALTPPAEMERMAAVIPRATFARIPEAGPEGLRLPCSRGSVPYASRRLESVPRRSRARCSDVPVGVGDAPASAVRVRLLHRVEMRA